MGWSEWIALGAAAVSSLISIISWRWARASAQEARVANALQLHSYRESLYVAFHELHGGFRAFQEHLSFEQVLQFRRHSIAGALYLSPQLNRQINSFYAKVILIREKGDSRQKALDDIYKHKDDPYLKDQFDSATRSAQELFEEIKEMAAEANSIGDAALAALKKEVCIDLPEIRPS